MAHSLLARPVVRYLITGGSVYLLELLIIVLAQRMGASAVWAVVLSFCVGTAVSFLLQKFVTFGDKRTHHQVVAKQMLTVGLLIVWNLAFSVVLTKLLQGHLPTVVIRTLALGTCTVWNFYLYKTRIFKHSIEILVD